MPPLEAFLNSCTLLTSYDEAEAPLLDLTDIQIEASSPPKRKRGRRCVTFAPALEVVRSTIHIHNYTTDEKRACWYDAYDWEAIRTERRIVLKRMEKGKNLNPSKHCTRGLEARTEVGCRRRHMAIVGAVHGILDEQDAQFRRRFVNPNVISHIYMLITRKSRAAAADRGLEDHKAIVCC
jgi:hypothetical protein